MKIHLHIERLVLEGLPFSGGDATVVGRSLEAELMQLIQRSDALSHWRTGEALSKVAAGEVRVTTESSPNHTGAVLAQAVYRALYGGGAGRSQRPPERSFAGARPTTPRENPK